MTCRRELFSLNSRHAQKQNHYQVRFILNTSLTRPSNTNWVIQWFNCMHQQPDKTLHSIFLQILFQSTKLLHEPSLYHMNPALPSYLKSIIHRILNRLYKWLCTSVHVIVEEGNHDRSCSLGTCGLNRTCRLIYIFISIIHIDLKSALMKRIVDTALLLVYLNAMFGWRMLVTAKPVIWGNLRNLDDANASHVPTQHALIYMEWPP
jgi:hypothetical protein